MQCPKCDSPAPDFRTAEGVVVNFCDGCHGLWFDRGELALYCETASDLPEIDHMLSVARVTGYYCPRCPDTRLLELPYMEGEDLLVDWCPGCRGAWLDKREIVKVELLATRYDDHTARIRRGLDQLSGAGYAVVTTRGA